MWDLNSSSASLSVSFESVVAKENFEIDKERNRRKMAWRIVAKSKEQTCGFLFLFRGEDICPSVLRGVKEETGVEAEFVEVFRLKYCLVLANSPAYEDIIVLDV
ncbi:hypothetical protein CMV_016925 [Castanea mollissima]|uniref:Nudix hydrolase domain-containing protein n=1 Tax=Castanea mollissima TaxID=60419 RepID=A0A8J4QRT6_9ROSI|nr:hypothetical protein CMV_016925 [Castanea mollissima]